MKVFQVFSAFVFAAVITVSLNSCALAQQTQSDLPSAQTQGPLPSSGTLAGNYLSGRFAQRAQDWDAAQNYMNEVINFDRDNALLEQRAFLLSMGAMQYARARELAEKIVKSQDNVELALIYLACEALARDDYKASIDYAARLPEDGFGQYTKPLLTAWAQAGMGDAKKAVAGLEKKAGKDDPTFNIHAGLIAEMSGDEKAARRHYKKATESGLTLHTAVVVASFHQRHGTPATAQTIYDELGKLYPSNPFMNVVRPASETPKSIARASEGAAIALFDLASLLYERRAFDSAQIYGSMVLLLSPKAPFAMMMMGDIAALYGQYQKAEDSYDTVAENSPLYWLSRQRVAEVYEISGDTARAVSMLQKLSANKDLRLQALANLGDLYRRNEDYVNALKSYDDAIASVEKLTEQHWPLIYARGMSLERLDNWERAEKDLLQALSFQPDNPMILNFLGYSWADKGVNMDKALEYIRRAVALRPDDGYIVDSLGWALYRSGKTEESVEWLEKAVGIVPDDTTILDHLGDAYWQTGRKDEARFKWKRAHELSRDQEFRTTLSKKLEKGIEPTPAMAARKEAKL